MIPCTGGNVEITRVTTPQLKTLLDHYRRTTPAAHHQRFLIYLRQVAARYEAELLQLEPGITRARAALRLLDEEVDRSHVIPSTCREGCAHCCTLPVEVTADEAALLAEAVRDGCEIALDRLADQARREKHDPAWRSRTDPGNRCAFLRAEGTCSAYDRRPSACRKHLVISPPGACAQPGGEPQAISIPLGEVLVSVALSLPENSIASLARSVTLAMERNLQSDGERNRAEPIGDEPCQA